MAIKWSCVLVAVKIVALRITVLDMSTYSGAEYLQSGDTMWPTYSQTKAAQTTTVIL